MWSKITRRIRFEAAHFLPDHPSHCSKMHGHSWQAWITLEGSVCEEGPEAGTVVDMGHLATFFKNELEPHLDHSLLNETLPDEFQPPTTENVARYLFFRFKKEFPQTVEVTVRETENQEATSRG